MAGWAAGNAAASISCGHVHTCALLVNGSVVCWGDNTHGQLGIGSTSPNTLDSLALVNLGPGVRPDNSRPLAL